MNCRHCGGALDRPFLDLGVMPPSNAYLSAENLGKGEAAYPLRLHFCQRCGLVQTEDYTAAAELFSPQYAYFSSTSSSWVAHARDYCDMIQRRLALDEKSFVIEVACNDGYLLQHFVEGGIPCLGIEPTASTAVAAERLGVPVLREFFGARVAEVLARDARRADLIVGNNVYAHVPDINDFTAGLATVLKPGGTITLEFPHLLRLLKSVQFDTVYHEHYSYLSLGTVVRIFGSAGMRVFDVEELPTHGGSLRVYGCHDGNPRLTTPAVAHLIAAEEEAGLNDPATYDSLQPQAERIAESLVAFLQAERRAGRKVIGYGAAAKGNTLLNYAGIGPELLPMICDAAPSKQGYYMPGSHIPIVAPEMLQRERPEVVLILPWNIADEVCEKLHALRATGTRFFKVIPELTEL